MDVVRSYGIPCYSYFTYLKELDSESRSVAIIALETTEPIKIASNTMLIQ